MKNSSRAIWIVPILIGTIALGACDLLSPVVQTPGPDQVDAMVRATVAAELTQAAATAQAVEPTPDHGATAAAQTAAAEMTRAAEATATPTETPTEQIIEPTPTTEAVLPTATPPPPTATSPPPTATVPPGATQVGTIPCDRAEFVADIAVLAGSSFEPGTAFIKTWRLKNTGSCTWTSDYAIVWSSGERMGGPLEQGLGRSVRPGETIDLSVNLKAPAKIGTYEGKWLLQNSQDDRFGHGATRNQALSVRIGVSELTQVVYNLVNKMCDAAWRNEDADVSCPGTVGDPNGWVIQDNGPSIETGITEDEPALVMQPRAVTDGLIRGRYPEFQVQAGDHFRAVIGCMSASPACDVSVLLRYRIGGGDVQTIQSWVEKSDGKITKIDIDLTFLAGNKVQFILSVRARGDWTDDRVFWLRPRIVR